jgi:hypothetical protein
MTHARESSLSSLASCSRPSSPTALNPSPSAARRAADPRSPPIAPDRRSEPCRSPSAPEPCRSRAPPSPADPRVPPIAPDRPRSPLIAPEPCRSPSAPERPRALPIPERPQVEHPARARPSLPIPEHAVSRRRCLVSVQEVRGARARAARTSSPPPSPLSCVPFRRGHHSQNDH